MTDLPQGWREVALGEVAETQLGKMLNSKKQTGTAVMPYLRNINLRWGGFDLTDVKQMDIFPNEVEQFTLRNGDLLICEGGEPGRCAVWNRDGEMAFQNAMHRVRPHAELSPQFLALQFEAKVRNGELEHLFSGVTIKHFSQSKLRAVEVPLPPLAEQERIVEILEEQFSRLDSALASVKAVREKAKAFRRSLLHAAFNGDLTGGTEGWRNAPLGEVAEIIGGRTPSRLEARLEESPRGDRNIPFYKVGDMNASPKYFDTARVYLAADELTTFGVSVIQSGSVVFPKAGGAIATNKKRVMRTEGCIDLNCMAVMAKDGLNPSLLFYFFDGINLSDLSTGSVLPQIGKKAVSELAFSITPRAEQERIVEILEEQFSKLDKALEVANQLESRIASERRSLLHAAFTGELTSQWRKTHV